MKPCSPCVLRAAVRCAIRLSSQPPLPRQQRQRLPVIVRHILHQNGVGRDRDHLIPPLHDIAIRRQKHIVAMQQKRLPLPIRRSRRPKELQIDRRWWRRSRAEVGGGGGGWTLRPHRRNRLRNIHRQPSSPKKYSAHSPNTPATPSPASPPSAASDPAAPTSSPASSPPFPATARPHAVAFTLQAPSSPEPSPPPAQPAAEPTGITQLVVQDPTAHQHKYTQSARPSSSWSGVS